MFRVQSYQLNSLLGRSNVTLPLQPKTVPEMIISSSNSAFKTAGGVRQFFLILIFGVFGIVGSDFCRAETVLVGSDEIFIPLPLTHCVLEESNHSDSRLIEYYRNAAEQMDQVFLIGSANCQQLEDWRKGRLPTLNDWAGAYAPSMFLNETILMNSEEFVAELRQEYLDTGVQEMEELLKESQSTMNKAADDLFANKLHVGEITQLGILDRDKNSLYVGYVAPVTTELGEIKQALGIRALTLVGGKFILLELCSVYQDIDTIYETLRNIKDWSHRTQLQN